MEQTLLDQLFDEVALYKIINRLSTELETRASVTRCANAQDRKTVKHSKKVAEELEKLADELKSR